MIAEQAPAIPYLWDNNAAVQSKDVVGVAQRLLHHARPQVHLDQVAPPKDAGLAAGRGPPRAEPGSSKPWSAGALGACHAGYDVTHGLHRCTEFPYQTTRHVGDRDVVGELHPHTPHRRLGHPRARTRGVGAVPDMNGAQIRTIER